MYLAYLSDLSYLSGVSERKGFFLRMPEEARKELDAAYWATHQNRDEILLQGFAIWRLLQQQGRLESALERAGYQPKQRPERAREDATALNGQGPAEPAPGTHPGPAGVADDGWGLDGDASSA